MIKILVISLAMPATDDLGNCVCLLKAGLIIFYANGGTLQLQFSRSRLEGLSFLRGAWIDINTVKKIENRHR